MFWLGKGVGFLTDPGVLVTLLALLVFIASLRALRGRGAALLLLAILLLL